MPGILQVRLSAVGPWRIGPNSGDRDRVDRVFHSDSLYSAVSSAMARLGLLEEWLDATARAPQPAVRFSSCFPFQGDVMFVVPPRNLWPPPASAKVRWKGARFIPLSAVESLVAGRPIGEEHWTVDGDSECLIFSGAQGPFRVSVRSSAAVDREGAGVEPHSTACLEFAPRSGVWFLVAFHDDRAREQWEDRVQGALRVLADSGFGGERSSGWGRVESIRSSEHRSLLEVPAEPDAEIGWWMLSLFHPASTDAIDWKRGNYALTTRGGRIESDARSGDAKKPTRMVTEGSVLASPGEPLGAATDVAPENFPHPVYRAGFALAIPVPMSVTARPAS
jgi:CRISPR type III-A-associated RAMP protein Csm4